MCQKPRGPDIPGLRSPVLCRRGAGDFPQQNDCESMSVPAYKVTMFSEKIVPCTRCSSGCPLQAGWGCSACSLQNCSSPPPSLTALPPLCCRELLETTCRLANTLKRYGVRRGDRVAIYMPVSPLAVAAMLACARIGAIHNVIFAGFSVGSLAGRINDGEHVGSGMEGEIWVSFGLQGLRVVADITESHRDR